MSISQTTPSEKSIADRAAIIEMVAEGKISVAEAIALIDQKATAAQPASVEPSVAALKADEAAASFAEEVPIEELKANKPETFHGLTITKEDVAPGKDDGRPRWLKIRVRDLDTGRNRVSVTLPIGFVNFGLGIARRFGADFDDNQQIDEIWRLVKEGQRGMLIDVEDEEDNEQVQIYLD